MDCDLGGCTTVLTYCPTFLSGSADLGLQSGSWAGKDRLQHRGLGSLHYFLADFYFSQWSYLVLGLARGDFLLTVITVRCKFVGVQSQKMSTLYFCSFFFILLICSTTSEKLTLDKLQMLDDV